MEKRISKSFRAIFASLYPNFDENETQNSEEYFNFILRNYPDKSEIIQLDRYEEIISDYKFAFDILEEKQYILENNFEIKPNSVLVLELKK